MATEAVPAPIPGKVIRVNFSVGDAVREGDSICEIESMKMENPILAPVSGKITEITISADQVVKTGENLATIEF